MASQHTAAHRRRRPSTGPRHRRVGLLIGAAALGALGVAVLSPVAPSTAMIARADITSSVALTDRPDAQRVSPEADRDAEQVRALNDPANEKAVDRATGATAVALSRSRAEELAGIARQRDEQRAQQRAHQRAVDAAAARQADDRGTAGPDAYKAYARGKVGAAQFACLDRLWTRESGWRPTARNPGSTAYGIAQLLDSTWAVTGVAKTPNGYRQVDAGLAYIDAAYPAGPCSAWAHSQGTGWY